MPLLNKVPFVPVEPPPDLDDDEEVFFCRSTREIFRDYEQYCERIILCNSLVWSCSLTGRSNLTYQEAAASEDKVKSLLKKFPLELRIPVLYLASLCERKSLVELAEDVYSFAKERYFIGETVHATLDSGDVVPCHVMAVIAPPKEAVEKYEHKQSRSPKKFNWIPAHLYKYEVVRMDNNEEVIFSGEELSRKESAYTKDKNKLYIKQFFNLDNGIWRLKESSNSKYGISKVKFDRIFCGDPPDMTIRERKVVERKKSGKKQETLNKYFKATDKKVGLSPRKSPKKSNGLLDRRGGIVKRKRRTKKEIEEALKRGDKLSPSMKAALELKKKLRQETKEKKKNLADFYKEWNAKREDLECEDLRDLPVPTEVNSRLPHTLVGEVIMLLEFLHSFRSILPVKDFFPYGVTFDLVERALVEKEIAGPLADILQLLLSSVFDLQDQENDEIKETDVKINPGLIFTRGDAIIKYIVKAATACDGLAKKNFSLPLNQLSVDPTTISEVLRLHLLASGAIPNKSKVAKWRYQARGGYCNNDDPAIILKWKRPQLIEKLGLSSIYELSADEKMAVLNCLVEQVMTYSSLRDTIEEGCEKARVARVELRSVRAAEVKKEKEEAMRLKAEKKMGGISNTAEEDKKEKENRELRSLNVIKTNAAIPDLLSDIRKALASSQLSPLGTDRAFRRYWIFSSIPGLFVESGDEFPGPCIPNGTPQYNGPASYSEEDTLAYVRRLFEDSYKDKENLNIRSPHNGQTTPSKRQLLSEKNGSPVTSLVNGGKEETERRQQIVCSGDSTTCPVHGSDRPKTWSYFSEPSQVEELIAGLNKRGLRERRLRLALSQEKETILERLTDCPADKFNYFIPNGAKVFTELQNKSMKQYDQANSGFDKELPVEKLLESSLRDYILETEEKIFLGVVGGIKVKDRDAWREAIQNFSYDQQCKKLTWGSSQKDDESDTETTVKEEPVDEDVKKEKEEVDDESRASTPSLEEANAPVMSWPGIQSVSQRQLIIDLSSAILQLGQAIEFKYLKRPLGLDPKEREEKKIALVEPKFPTVAMGKWEEGLMTATSIPQLFLYLTTLDNSVCWEKSALHASCRICRRKKDPEIMLLCDTCNKGYHMYCLKPKITKIPPGDWHCPKCRPKEKHISPKKKRRLFSENSDNEDDNENNECKECGSTGAQLGCGSCETWLHLDCVNPPMRRVPKSKWFCHDCRNANSQQQSSANRKSGGATAEVKEEAEEAMEVDVEEPKAVKAESGKKSSGKDERRKESKDRTTTASLTSKPKVNGYINGFRKTEQTAPAEEDNEERASRRKCSKAATAKISHFAKQLRSTNPDGDSDSGGEEESSLANGRSRRDRRSMRRSETVKSRDLPLDNAALQEILDVVMHDPVAPPFLRPVTKHEAPDYHEIIKRPMDFGTIKHKLNMLAYQRNSDLIADAELLFNNCVLYNDEETDIYKDGEKLRELFYRLCNERNLIKEEESSSSGPPAKKAKTSED